MYSTFWHIFTLHDYEAIAMFREFKTFSQEKAIIAYHRYPSVSFKENCTLIWTCNIWQFIQYSGSVDFQKRDKRAYHALVDTLPFPSIAASGIQLPIVSIHTPHVDLHVGGSDKNVACMVGPFGRNGIIQRRRTPTDRFAWITRTNQPSNQSTNRSFFSTQAQIDLIDQSDACSPVLVRQMTSLQSSVPPYDVSNSSSNVKSSPWIFTWSMQPWFHQTTDLNLELKWRIDACMPCWSKSHIATMVRSVTALK